VFRVPACQCSAGQDRDCCSLAKEYDKNNPDDDKRWSSSWQRAQRIYLFRRDVSLSLSLSLRTATNSPSRAIGLIRSGGALFRAPSPSAMWELEGYVPISSCSPANSRTLSRRRRLLTGWSPACLSQVHLKRSFLIAFMTESNRSACLTGHLDIERFTRVFRFWWFLGVIYWPRTMAGRDGWPRFLFLFLFFLRIKVFDGGALTIRACPSRIPHIDR